MECSLKLANPADSVVKHYHVAPKVWAGSQSNNPILLFTITTILPMRLLLLLCITIVLNLSML